MASASAFPWASLKEQVTHFLPSMQKKKGKKERELEKQKAEKELSRIEEALMDPGRQPESADDFDRLVLSSPDSSILWLQYMAFHLQATEIEKARAVAERALKTISFRSGLRLFTLSWLTEFATMAHFFMASGSPWSFRLISQVWPPETDYSFIFYGPLR